MNNMAIWDEVSTTDPSATKAGTVDGQSITTINGVYVAKRATERFGPIGIGWGYEIVEERYDDAGPIFDAETKALITNARNHTIRLRFWYMEDGVKGEFEQFGHTKYLYRSKYGFTVDPEAPKKSLTDAMKKCASLLGFCADIYLGMFDDQAYVEEQRQRERLESAEDKIEEAAKQEEEHAKWLGETIRLIGESKTMSMLGGIYKTSARKLELRKDEKGMRRLTAAMEKAKARIEAEKGEGNDKPV